MFGVITEELLMGVNDWRSAANREHLVEPLEFDSFLRPQVWGGDALSRYLGKPVSGTVPIGESWEVSGLSEHPSIVLRGAFAGQSLSDLWTSHREDLAGRIVGVSTFPLFVKWLDCRQFLSVQVHPNDAMAREVLGQVSGKSEAWVVVHAEPTARIYAGLRPGVTQHELLSRLEAGTVAECLHSFVPQVGDCISLPAGTVHSAGGGVVFAEVQQPSDTTFRLFDWNRLGLDGQSRPLHLDMAMKSITWPQGPVSPSIPIPLNCLHGVHGELLLQTPAFHLERYTVRGMWPQPHSGEMTIWMVTDGAAVLDGAGCAPRQIVPRGSTVLIPAAARGANWAAADVDKPCRLLCIRLPSVPSRNCFILT